MEKVSGSGGSGITYRAFDSRLKRLVAIKEFVPSNSTRSGLSLTSSGTSVSQTNKEQFFDEARTLAQFQHRNIVKVLAAFEENNTVYLVMEYLDGRSLQSLVESQGRLALDDALAHLTQIADALEVIHGANLIHRDIKPGNIMLCNDGRVVLIDFGLKKWIIPQDKYQTLPLTATTCFGTPGYAPPEQYMKQGDVGIHTDVYALGATLYFLLTGQVPVAALERSLGVDLVPPREIVPALSSQVNSAILKSLELPREKRFPAPKQFLNALKGPGKQPVPGGNGLQVVIQSSPSQVAQTRKKVTVISSNDRLRVSCPHCQRVNKLPPHPENYDFFQCFDCDEKFEVNIIQAKDVSPSNSIDSCFILLIKIILFPLVAGLLLSVIFFVAAILFILLCLITGVDISINFLYFLFLTICITLVVWWLKK